MLIEQNKLDILNQISEEPSQELASPVLWIPKFTYSFLHAFDLGYQIRALKGPLYDKRGYLP